MDMKEPRELPQIRGLVLFRLDFGGHVGLGHLARCSILSMELRRLGFTTMLLHSEVEKGFKQRAKHLLDQYSECRELQAPDDDLSQLTLGLARALKLLAPRLLVLDSYKAKMPFVTDAKRLSPILQISDSSTSLEPTFWLNYSFGLASGSPDDKNSSTERLIGSSYVPVAAQRKFSLQTESKTYDFVISIGGGNRSDELLKIIRSIRANDLKSKIAVLSIGESQKLNTLANSDPHLEIHQGKPLGEVLTASKLAIVSAGVSLMESIAEGVKSVALITAENQIAGVKQMALEPKVLIANSVDFFQSKQFLAWCNSGLHEFEKTELETSLFLRSNIDSLGAARLAMKLGFGRSTDLVFRKAEVSDLPILLRWRNEVSARENSLNSEEVTPRDHLEWFDKFTKKRGYLRLAEWNGVPVGQFRLEPKNAHEWRLSYSVDPVFRGMGFGSRIVFEAAHQAEPGNFIVALVHRENRASIAALESANFTQSEKFDGDFLRYFFESKQSKSPDPDASKH
jgi:spore coat polysaccharide biosynthesis predicted glycosyltransferase SpsG/RimJ/RimL family protein N-acetyltransferase